MLSPVIGAAGAGRHDTVKGNTFARPDDEGRADRHIGGRHLFLAAVLAENAHGRRRQIEQRRDRAPRPTDAPAF
ncbi:MAG: hypothetical protein R3F54_31500 [Alphaproteobacteria bacterium]